MSSFPAQGNGNFRANFRANFRRTRAALSTAPVLRKILLLPFGPRTEFAYTPLSALTTDVSVIKKATRLQQAASDTAKGTDLVQHQAITRLAHCTIQLSQIAPRLSRLAGEHENEALEQAGQLRRSADMVRSMTETLQHTMLQLKLSTQEIAELTNLINRIADETRMISINAGIVAARTGNQGLTFAVLAKEIRELSGNTTNATRDVNLKVRRLEENTQRTVDAAGLASANSSADAGRPGLGRLLAELEEADRTAQRQVTESKQLSALGANLRDLSEEMIGAVGTFQLDVHDRIDTLVTKLSLDPGLRSADPLQQVAALRTALKCNPFIELAYITNAEGMQTLENVTRGNLRAAYAATGR
jgi:hypothetical protein